jgi:hypothetical protein
VRARTQSCGEAAVDYEAYTWLGLAQGEVRVQDETGGIVASAGGPSSASAQAFDPIAGGDPCARVADETQSGTYVLDFPAPGGAGYTVLGSPTVHVRIIQNVQGTPNPKDTMIAARLLDVDPSGDELLVSRGIYRPYESAIETVFQLAPMGFHIAPDHHLQLELLGNEAPTMRASNVSFTKLVSNVEVRIPVAEPPDGGQIQSPAPKEIPFGYVPEPGSTALLASGSALVAMLARRRRTQ